MMEICEILKTSGSKVEERPDVLPKSLQSFMYIFDNTPIRLKTQINALSLEKERKEDYRK